jgi:hypothetical protein
MKMDAGPLPRLGRVPEQELMSPRIRDLDGSGARMYFYKNPPCVISFRSRGYFWAKRQPKAMPESLRQCLGMGVGPPMP